MTGPATSYGGAESAVLPEVGGRQLFAGQAA
jgi:hypothetical protein